MVINGIQMPRESKHKHTHAHIARETRGESANPRIQLGRAKFDASEATSANVRTVGDAESRKFWGARTRVGKSATPAGHSKATGDREAEARRSRRRWFTSGKQCDCTAPRANNEIALTGARCRPREEAKRRGRRRVDPSVC